PTGSTKWLIRLCCRHLALELASQAGCQCHRRLARAKRRARERPDRPVQLEHSFCGGFPPTLGRSFSLARRFFHCSRLPFAPHSPLFFFLLLAFAALKHTPRSPLGLFDLQHS